MGFFQRVNRIWSGADFWDQKENQQQRQQYAAQDEEERRRREAEAAARASVVRDTGGPADTPINQPRATAPNFLQIGDLNKPTPGLDFSQPLQKAQPASKPGGIGGFLHKVTHNGITNAVGDAAKGITGIVTAPVKLGVNDARILAARATHNKAALEHASNLGQENIDTLIGIPQGIAAAGYKLASSLNPAGGDVYQREHTFTGVPSYIFGNKPIPTLQKSYKDTALEKGKGYAGTQSFLEVLMDVLGGKGGIKGYGKLRSRLVKATPEEAAVIAAEDIAPAVEEVGTATAAPTPTRTPIVEPVIDATDNTPAFVRKAARTADDNARAAADAEEAARDPLNRPAYQHKADIQNAVDEGEAKLNEFINDHPNASLVDIEVARSAIEGEVLSNIRALQDARFGPTETPNIPPPTDPIALAKATDATGTVGAAGAAPVADFSKAINAPLQKAEPVVPRKATAPIAPATTDASGNAALVSDAERARQLTAEGTPPTPGPSPVAVTEDARAAAANRAAAAETTMTPAGRAPELTPDESVVHLTGPDQLKDVYARLTPEQEAFLTDETRNIPFDSTDRPHLSAATDAFKASGPGSEQISLDELRTFSPNLDAALRRFEAQSAPTSTARVLGETPAPRTREQLINRVDDQQLQSELLDLAPAKERVNLQEADNAAKAVVNNLSDDELVSVYSNAQKFESPDDLFRGLAASRRLQGLGTSEARAAIRNITDAVAEQSSKSGLWQRASQILFEDMPTSMKVEYLTKKLGQAGAELTDADRQMLETLLSNSDAVTERLVGLQDEARNLLDSGAINNESMAAATRQRVGELATQIKTTAREQELAQGKAWEFYSSHMPKTATGKQFAQIGRTMMLSAPSGRAFDIISTTATTADDLLNRGVSNLVGKVLNKAPGVRSGTLTDTVIAPRKLVKGAREGAGNFIDALRGRSRVEDFMTESRRATRGDIQGGSAFRRVVRAATNLPTELTRGLREEELFRQGMQEASQQGLKGAARRTYAELRAAVPTEAQLHDAIEIHMKANMLHNNKVSRFLNGIAQSLDRGGNGWLAAPIRNQIMPFTSWAGGFLHRTFTDKNVLYNAYKIVDTARKSDIQGVVDNVSKLAVNSGEAYAAGYLLSKAGVLTTTDANGDSYGGVYFHIGDRYIPVAIAGTASVPIILGNALQQAETAHNNGESPMTAFSNAVVKNTLRNAGVQSVFGGDNTIQSTIAALTAEGGNVSDAMAAYVGDFVRQYIPALASDINALVDAGGEAPQTKIMKENPETGRDKTDVIASELAKTQAKIPLLSQELPREEGKPARDILDRLLHGNRETTVMAQERQQKLTDAQEKKRREKDDVPDTKDAIKARTESGDFKNAIAGWQQQLADLEKKGKDAAESDKQDIRDNIKRLQITRDSGYGPDVIKLYDSTTLSEWRAMANPDSDEYDPETAGLLKAYDDKLAKAGVSLSRKSGDKNKFYEKEKKGGGRGGRGSKPRIVTDIGTISGDTSFSPLKALPANYGETQSPIPQLEKVANYSRRPKKISVSRGR